MRGRLGGAGGDRARRRGRRLRGFEAPGNDDFYRGTETLGYLNARDNNAELGYWIANPYWGRGYCIEAAREMVRYGFEILGLHRIHSSHFGSSSGSGRVMQKIGMIREGTGREHYKKWGEYEGRVEYGLPTGEWRAAQGYGWQRA
jgi:RimJ/RimL family protein N-acetyltransferase